MPKGTLGLVAVLLVLLSGLGGYSYYSKINTPKKAVSADIASGDLGADIASGNLGTGNQSNVDGATFAPQQFGEWGSTPPEKQYAAGEVIVANPPANFTATIGSAGYSILETTRLNNLGTVVYRLGIPAGVTVEAARRDLAANYPGISLDANHHFQSQADTSAGAKLPRAMAGWSEGTAKCGAGIRLGMIDAAVDVNHPALRGQNVEFRSFHKKGRGPGPANHGTAVAAIMVGKLEWGGLLPGAVLKAGNMFQTSETGRSVGSAIGLLKSMNWLVGEKLHAINFSVAGSDNKVVRSIIKKAQAKNVIMIAAAGNWGTDKRPAYPAAYNEVLAITAFGAKGVLYSHANFGSYIDFAAPGVKLYTASPGGGGKVQSGTSFASPYLTVLVALDVARAQNANSVLTANNIRTLLSKTTHDMGEKGKDRKFGWGYVSKQPAC